MSSKALNDSLNVNIGRELRGPGLIPLLFTRGNIFREVKELDFVELLHGSGRKCFPSVAPSLLPLLGLVRRLGQE